MGGEGEEEGGEGEELDGEGVCVARGWWLPPRVAAAAPLPPRALPPRPGKLLLPPPSPPPSPPVSHKYTFLTLRVVPNPSPPPTPTPPMPPPPRYAAMPESFLDRSRCERSVPKWSARAEAAERVL